MGGVKVPAAIACLSFLAPLLQDVPALALDDTIVLKGAPQVQVVVLRHQPAEAVREARTGQLFASLCTVNSLEDGAKRLHFTIHVPDAPLLPFGERAGRFLGFVWASAERRWGRLCARLWEAPLDVWLTRQGPAGGEQVARNLYIYNLASDRTGIEWARELAHEYGHYLLPAASGYSDPENWPNGVLGERLFLKWLLEDVDAGNLDPKDLPFVSRNDLADYCAKQVDPLIDRFRLRGPEEDVLARSDRRGFDAFTGLMLGLQDLYGPRVLMDLLDFLPRKPGGLRATDFLAAFTEFANQSSDLIMNLTRGAGMAYVPAGRFQVRPDARSAATKLAVEGCTVKPAGDGWLVTAARSEWRHVSTAPQGIILHWRRLGVRE